MTQLTFVPVRQDEALALRRGSGLAVRTGCAATRSLVAALEADETEPGSVTEEAEFAALSYAGVLSLFHGSAAIRLVLAADLESAQVIDGSSPYGEVHVRDLRWSQVRALFTDETQAAEAVLQARSALSDSRQGYTLAAALDVPAVGKLVDDYDLLWFAPEELDLVVSMTASQPGSNQAD
jgi:hypothetical protein